MGDRILKAGRITVRELDMKRFPARAPDREVDLQRGVGEELGVRPHDDEEIDHLAET